MSRLNRHLFTAAAVIVLASAGQSHAQYGGGGPHGGAGPGDQSADEAKKKKRDEEFGTAQAPLPALRNAGPCPFVKVLYDAARYHEFENNVEASANVGYTGEIENIGSVCEYKIDEPIRVKMEILFELGRGPRAASAHKTYRYWVAVTDRNRGVLDKASFLLPVDFPQGQDRVTIRESLNDIVIPRENQKVSGSNFEVLVGFEVTPEMAAFNRDGKRFRANAGQAKVAATRP
jgi:hypothetical protein